KLSAKRKEEREEAAVKSPAPPRQGGAAAAAGPGDLSCGGAAVREEAEARQDALVRAPRERGGDVRGHHSGRDVLRRLLLRQLQHPRPHRLRQGIDPASL